MRRFEIMLVTTMLFCLATGFLAYADDGGQKPILTDEQRVAAMGGVKEIVKLQCDNRLILTGFISQSALTQKQKDAVLLVLNWECDNQEKINKCADIGVDITKQAPGIKSVDYLASLGMACYYEVFEGKLPQADKLDKKAGKAMSKYDLQKLGLALVDGNFTAAKAVVQK